MAHEYKFALQRQVLHNGETKNRAQQYKLALRQEGNNIENNKCYNNVNETDEDASLHIMYINISRFFFSDDVM